MSDGAAGTTVAAARGPESADAAPAPPIVAELHEQLARLAPAEQRVIADMIRRATPDDDRPPLDALGLVHPWLKAVLGGPEAALSEEAESALGPSVVKSFDGAPFIPFPAGATPLDAPLGATLRRRHSSHNFDARPMELGTLAALLRHAYGVKFSTRAYNLRSFPFRTAPSAGGLQPIDVYVVANALRGAEQGLYYFDAPRDGLVQLDTGNLRWRFARCCIFNDWIAASPVVLILAANLHRVLWKYGARGYRFVHADAGVLAQNLYLVGTGLQLNTCAVAAYFDDLVNGFVGLDGHDEFTVLLFAVGHRPRPAGMPALSRSLPDLADPDEPA